MMAEAFRVVKSVREHGLTVRAEGLLGTSFPARSSSPRAALFQDLARWTLGQLFLELDRLGLLEPGQVVSAEGVDKTIDPCIELPVGEHLPLEGDGGFVRVQRV